MTVRASQSQDAILSDAANENSSRFAKVPARWVLSACLCIANGIMFSHRVNLTIAIVAMMNSTKSDVDLVDGNVTTSEQPACPYPDDYNENLSEGDEDGEIKLGHFVWSPSLQGVVLGGFYYGYVLTQVAGGRLSERFAPKVIFLSGMTASAFLTLLVPVVVELNFGLFVALRVITGAAQGFTFPASYSMVSCWVPRRERSLHIAILMSGSLLGTIVSLPIAGYLCNEGFAGGWPSAFYVFGIVGVVFSVPCYFLIYSKPRDHPRITSQELNYIEEDVPPKPKKTPPVPWPAALKSIPIWALTFSRTSSAFAFFIVMNKIPTYLDVILHYPIKENGVLSSLLYVMEAVTQVLSGFLSDLVQRKKWLSTNATRKVFQTIASSGGGLCLLCVPFVRCNGTAVVVLLTASLGILGFNSGGEMPVIADMAPAYTGSLFGLTNTCASSTGFLAPLIAGAFLDGHDHSMDHWSYIFYLSAAFCFTGCLVFLLLAEAKLQPWAEVPTSTESESKVKGQEKDPERY